MADVQVRPDVSVRRLLGDLAHEPQGIGVEHYDQDSRRGELPSRGAIWPSPPFSKAAAAYEADDQRPMVGRFQDPVVAAATAFFQASKEDQREALQELWGIAKQAGPSTEFVDDFEVGNYSLAFVGMVNFLLDIYPFAQIQKWIINMRSSVRLRNAMKLESRGLVGFLLGSKHRSQINRLVRNPLRKAQFVGTVKKYARVGDAGRPLLRTNHPLGMIDPPTARAPVRIVQQDESALVIFHVGNPEGVEAQLIAYEVPAADLEHFVRDLISDGFLKVE